jgi:single-stranded DNA-binding protein
MSAIEVAFLGTLVKVSPAKTSATGKRYQRLSLRVGDGDNVLWVNTTIFGDLIDEIAEHAVKGAALYTEGRLSLDNWTAPDGTPRSGLSVAAWKCRPPEIGRRKAPKAKASQSTSIIPQREASRPTFDDAIGL